jgi:hypothetical protein
MANTQRNSTFSTSTEAHSVSSLETKFRSNGDPNPFTSKDLRRQEVQVGVQPTTKLLFARLMEATSIAIASHNRSGGATVSLSDGNLAGGQGFVVSVYPKRALNLTNSLTRQDILGFVVLNLDLLLQPGHALGTWFDEEHGIHVLDVVTLISKHHDAVRLGQQFCQRAIFDLTTCSNIPIASYPKQSDRYRQYDQEKQTLRKSEGTHRALNSCRISQSTCFRCKRETISTEGYRYRGRFYCDRCILELAELGEFYCG